MLIIYPRWNIYPSYILLLLLIQADTFSMILTPVHPSPTSSRVWREYLANQFGPSTSIVVRALPRLDWHRRTFQCWNSTVPIRHTNSLPLLDFGHLSKEHGGGIKRREGMEHPSLLNHSPRRLPRLGWPTMITISLPGPCMSGRTICKLTRWTMSMA